MLKILLLLCVPLLAGTSIQDRIYAQTVYRQIKPQVLAIGMSCDNDTCQIDWTPKPGVNVVFYDKQARVNQAKILAQKWKDGMITIAEKDALLRMMTLHLLGMNEQ